ncbi:aminoglycoside resistance protein [Mycobacterium sp. MS1601]|uniref:aminoglycoside phosphotransferase family protein n=1 Tax=Mycobacterium sp. MS1601 TaxID=1936029 RepID=UPI0009794D2D|nr:aminoglycoside phosphotransferase family protein [Mycobacterium sp. MS1601]AQA06617.1 aminoglycoside resistance protein [Mycobacterium sp. MS1601]
MIDLPAGVCAMAARGPQWERWVDELPGLLDREMDRWNLTPDGQPMHGWASLVLPVRSDDGASAVLKMGFPDPETQHEHLALRRWAGDGAVRLLSADPHHRALLLERLHRRDLNELWDIEACEIAVGLYRRLHVPALPQLARLSDAIRKYSADLDTLPRSAPLPRRLVEQAQSLSRDLIEDPSTTGVLIHTDLHYDNVLAADREPWLAIDPIPLNGDPHYEVAPLLWNRWDELAGDVRDGVRRRFYAVVEAAGFDEDRARAWVVIRMVHNAMWALTDTGPLDREWLTTCIAVAKAVQD